MPCHIDQRAGIAVFVVLPRRNAQQIVAGQIHQRQINRGTVGVGDVVTGNFGLGGGGQNADSGNQGEPQGNEQPLPEPRQQNRNSSDNWNEAEEGNGAHLPEDEYNEDDRLVNTRTNQTS